LQEEIRGGRLATNNPTMTLQDEWKNVDESFRQYRASQLALSATIIGVSGGVLYWIQESVLTPDLIAKGLLGLAVCAALLMQLLHTFGYMYHARSYVSLLRALTPNRSRSEKEKALRQYNDDSSSGTRFFTALDWVTVGAFSLCIFGLLTFGGSNLFNQGTPPAPPPPYEDLN